MRMVIDCQTRQGHVATLRRRGFTLIEVLLALALCGVVLSAAFSAVHLSWKYRTAGSLQVEQSQIARGLFQDLNLDVRSTVAFPEVPTTGDNLSQLSGMTSEMKALFQGLVEQEQQDFEGLSRIEEQVLQLESASLPDPVTFYGEPAFFVLLSDSKNYRFAHSGASGSGRGQPQHVVWFSKSGASVRVPFSISDGKLQFTTLPTAPEQVGLLRLVESFDARTTQASNSSRDVRWMQVAPNEMRASFRYSDGITWRTSWNSLEEKRNPTAVEVILQSDQQKTEDAARFVLRLPTETGF